MSSVSSSVRKSSLDTYKHLSPKGTSSSNFGSDKDPAVSDPSAYFEDWSKVSDSEDSDSSDDGLDISASETNSVRLKESENLHLFEANLLLSSNYVNSSSKELKRTHQGTQSETLRLYPEAFTQTSHISMKDSCVGHEIESVKTDFIGVGQQASAVCVENVITTAANKSVLTSWLKIGDSSGLTYLDKIHIAEESLKIAAVAINKSNSLVIAAAVMITSNNLKSNAIEFISLKNPQTLKKVAICSCEVTKLAFSLSQSHLCFAGLIDGTLQVFDLSQNASKTLEIKPIFTNNDCEFPVQNIMPVDKDDFKIVTTYSEGLINLYQWNIDALTMEMVKSVRVRLSIIHWFTDNKHLVRPAIASSHCSQSTSQLLIGTEQGEVLIYNLDDFSDYQEYNYGKLPIVALSASEHFFISADSDNTMALWDYGTTEPIRVLRTTTSSPTVFLKSLDDRSFLRIFRDSLVIYKTEEKDIFRFVINISQNQSVDGSTVCCAAVSDKHHIIAGTTDGNLLLLKL